ncbi:molecular chaperone [Sphingomonas sp.]|uniref:molecular chaperone n=1 Tax=Sphingomonas sp. TaxID=28214 RepID=UPI002DD67AA2|nr:molecular chaperone [Sphingomonas sp.]
MIILRLSRLKARLRRYAVLMLIGIVASTSALAMRVSPMVSELTTSGAGAVARIEVGNVSSVPLPFETRITRIDFDENGVLQETPADEDFLVFPPQGLVAASGRQMVRVQWVGKPDIPTSQAYYVWVRQLPVETNPQKIEGTEAAVAINVLYTMKSLVVVAPPGAKPQVEVASAQPQMIVPPTPEIDPALKSATQPEDKPAPMPGLQVVVTNKGNRYALMSGAKWAVSATGADGKPFERTYGQEELSQVVGVGYVAPAGGKRTFSLPTGVVLDPAKPVSIRFLR